GVVNVSAFSYDAVGNQLTAQNAGGAYIMAYDALNRVVAVSEPWGQGLAFGYDAAGNRTAVQDNQGGLTTSVYDGANRLLSRQLGGATPLRIDLAYQDNGLLSTEARYSNLAGTALVGTTAYLYDGVGRMTGQLDYDGAGALLASYGWS